VEWNAYPVEPAIYTALFHDPDECEDGSTYFRENMPKYGERLIEAYRGNTLEGLYFQHTALGGRILIAVSLVLSFVFADVWSAKRSDVGGGFGVSQYILAAISIVLLFFFNRKDKS
jgi:hypothetical protein